MAPGAWGCGFPRAVALPTLLSEGLPYHKPSSSIETGWMPESNRFSISSQYRGPALYSEDSTKKPKRPGRQTRRCESSNSGGRRVSSYCQPATAQHPGLFLTRCSSSICCGRLPAGRRAVARQHGASSGAPAAAVSQLTAGPHWRAVSWQDVATQMRTRTERPCRLSLRA